VQGKTAIRLIIGWKSSVLVGCRALGIKYQFENNQPIKEKCK
jgi:hypothetical protein